MKNNKGFTLIELLAVFVILGILFTVGVISYGRYLDKARKQSYDAMFESIYDASQKYMMDKGATFENKCSYSPRYGTSIGVCNASEQEYYGCEINDSYGCRQCNGCAVSGENGFTQIATAAELTEDDYLEKLIDPADQGSTCGAKIYARNDSSSFEVAADYLYIIELDCKRNNEKREYSVSGGMEVIEENTK